jgi:hypothetical protein
VGISALEVEQGSYVAVAYTSDGKVRVLCPELCSAAMMAAAGLR